ncbi:dynamin family protein [Moorena sp. SIO3A2]|uniref:dynamin family protein n=1 Tax=Moorena sp. SIO3A2 TaxID=2607841 RepID=UPI0013BD8011|nr:dynamin family protein [Moorena sp. SIO3A2]NER85968.1 GTPase [Moorena sp. SIO3A2]
MRSNIKNIFEAVEESINTINKEWGSFQDKIRNQLPPEYHTELEGLNIEFQLAVSELVKELSQPVLTLATTGTTSSGKSTLVNFLCGAEIVPVAVQEMSAGVVIVEYSETKSLKIDQTPGALWECGEWRNLTDEDIYDRLDQVMKSYLQANRDGKTSVACPQTTIYYPFRLVADPNLLDLPEKTKVRIMDLPGLAYVGDEGNGSVIRKCKEALCIVTYNSAETDRQKVSNLLQEVVDQVKELGGSPARMLFVMNRIDEFRKDQNWPDSEIDFFKKTVHDIKQKLTKELEEYQEDISALKVIKMSALPALFSMQMKSDDQQKSTQACRKIDSMFNFLIPEEIIEDLPRKVERWENHERRRVAQKVWEVSYAEEFHKYLKEHIDENFPQLVIPQIVDRFKAKAGNAVAEWAIQTTYAFINSSEENYQKECDNIAKIRQDISQFILQKAQELRGPFEQIENALEGLMKESGQMASPEQESIDPRTRTDQIIADIIRELRESSYQERADSLVPLYGWRKAMTEGVEEILEPVIESLDNGKLRLDSKTLQAANPTILNLLERTIDDLIDLGYSPAVAENGKEIEARTYEEKSNLTKLNDKLNQLADILKLLINEAVKKILEREMRRVRDALETLLNAYLSILEEGMSSIAPNIGISFSRSQLGKIDIELQPSFEFKAGFPIVEGTWLDHVEVPKHKRDWWSLWIWKRIAYYIETKERSSDNAKLPKTEDILKGWLLQKNQAEVEIYRQVADWFISQINSFLTGVESSQKEIVDRYQERLDKAHDQARLSHQQDLSIWNYLQLEAKQLEDNIKKAGKVLR